MKSPVVAGTRAEIQEFVSRCKSAGKTIGFVPTMGALHAGHASLLKRAVSENDVCILSIFVNPKQFGPREDLSRYPRTWTEDLALAQSEGVAAVYHPSVEEMYPPGFSTQVRVNGLDAVLCGAVRPGHFEGVSTVVLLLLNLMRPDRSYFGMKDWQQLAIIRKMCFDLAEPGGILGVPTVRESDGLAMSSRNRYLDAHAREIATAIPKALATAARLFLSGERNAETLVDAAQQMLKESGLKPQYLEMRDAFSLDSLSEISNRPAVLAVAQMIAQSGEQPPVRLIDNIILDAADAGTVADLMNRVNARQQPG